MSNRMSTISCLTFSIIECPNHWVRHVPQPPCPLGMKHPSQSESPHVHQIKPLQACVALQPLFWALTRYESRPTLNVNAATQSSVFTIILIRFMLSPPFFLNTILTIIYEHRRVLNYAKKFILLVLTQPAFKSKFHYAKTIDDPSSRRNVGNGSKINSHIWNTLKALRLHEFFDLYR